MGPIEIAGPVAAPVHLGEEGAPEHRGVGDGGAGERGEDRPARDRDQRQASRDAGDEPVHRVDRLPRHPRVEHDLAHQDEKRDREEGEALGRVDRVPDELLEADRAPHEDERPRDVDREEGEHDREPQHHEDDEAADEDGQDLVPLHPPISPRRDGTPSRPAARPAAESGSGSDPASGQSASAERPEPRPAPAPASGGRTVRRTKIAASRKNTGGAAEKSHHSGKTKVS